MADRTESEGLPRVATDLDAAAIVSRLDARARRGKLAGLRHEDRKRDSAALFEVDSLGTPFEHVMGARLEGGEIVFSLRRLWKAPVIFAVALLVTIEPGRYFVDQLIPASWGWIDTMWWYYPLTILPIPFMWRSASRRSRLVAMAEAAETIQKIAETTGGRVSGEA
ncbi:MAG: hypothetical protein H6811_10550 [Phycisphaeraceae bacterium]|nr:hypothetical protein [Phycisphaeraceae bacterium]